jgi:hypothetical protein
MVYRVIYYPQLRSMLYVFTKNVTFYKVIYVIYCPYKLLVGNKWNL